MKKISAILSAALLLSLSACSSETAQQVFEKASEKSLSADSVTMNMDIQMNIETDGISLDVPMTMSIQMQNMQDTSAVIGHTEQTVTLAGTSVSSEVWIADGNIYTDTSGTQTVTAYDSTQMDKKLEIVPYDSFESCTLTKEDSDKVLSCTVNSDKIDELINSLLSGSTDSTVADALAGLTFTMDDFVYKVDKDNNLKSMSFTAGTSGEVSGTEMAFTVTADAAYTDWNTTAVELPDLTGWGEATASAGTVPTAIALSDFEPVIGYEYSLVSVYAEESNTMMTPEEAGMSDAKVALWGEGSAQLISDTEVEEATYTLTDTGFTITAGTGVAMQAVPTETGFYISMNGIWLIFE